jgi:hypothetical protein
MMSVPASTLGPDQPFPGLRPYLTADHAWFFGRDSQISGLYRLLNGARFIAVVGSSGSGKSSLVAAGLLPKIAQEKRLSNEVGAKELPRWRYFTTRPGDAPFARLAASLAGPAPTDDGDAIAMHAVHRETLETTLRESSFGLAAALRESVKVGSSSVLLVVDQFEEIFRFAPIGKGAGRGSSAPSSGDEAAAFVQMLMEASSDSSTDIHVMLTMRSDYIGECARFSGLAELVAANQFLVPMLTRDEREEVIRDPIAQAGGIIDDAFVQRLLNDSAGEFDQLPVLQHALMRLWNVATLRQAKTGQVDPPSLTQEDYDTIGGIAHALDMHADEVWKGLGVERSLVVEQCFKSLAELDRAGRAIRRALPFERLLAETGVGKDDLTVVVDRFRQDDCSFLLPPPQEALAPETLVDIGHEALIRNWKRLSGGPVAGPVTQGREDWLAGEAEDGMAYRVLLNLATGTAKPTLPLDQVEERLKWWNNRNRTEAWAERYGDRLDAVLALFQNSRVALAAEQRRKQQEKETAGELARQKEEALRLERRRLEERAEQQEALAAQQTKLAKTRARMNKIILLMLVVALALAAGAGWAWRTATQTRDQAIATTIWSRLAFRDALLRRDEVDALWTLATSDAPVRKHFLAQLEHNPTSYLSHLGWGPHNSLPVFWAVGLRPSAEDRVQARDAVLRHLAVRDPELARHATETLAYMAPWLTDQDAQVALDAVLDTIKRRPEISSADSLAKAALVLLPRASEPKGKQALGQLVEQFESRERGQTLWARPLMVAIERFASGETLRESSTRFIGAMVRSPEKCSLRRQDLRTLVFNLTSSKALEMVNAALTKKLNKAISRFCFNSVVITLAAHLDVSDARHLADNIVRIQSQGGTDLDLDAIIPVVLENAQLTEDLALLDILLQAFDEQATAESEWDSVTNIDMVLSRLPRSELARRSDQLVEIIFRDIGRRRTPSVSGGPVKFIKAMMTYLPPEHTNQTIDKLIMWPPTDRDGNSELAALAEALAAKMSPQQAAAILTKEVDNFGFFEVEDAAASSIIAVMGRANGSDLVVKQLSTPTTESVLILNRARLAAALGTQLPASLRRELVDAVLSVRERALDFTTQQNVDDVLNAHVDAMLRLILSLDDAQIAEIFDRIMLGIFKTPSDSSGRLSASDVRLTMSLIDRLPAELAWKWLKVLVEQRSQMPSSNSRIILGQAAAAFSLRVLGEHSKDVRALAQCGLAESVSDSEAVAWASVITKLQPHEPKEGYVMSLVEVLTYPTAGGAAGKLIMDQLHGQFADAPGGDAGLPAMIDWLKDHYSSALEKPIRQPSCALVLQ